MEQDHILNLLEIVNAQLLEIMMLDVQQQAVQLISMLSMIVMDK